MQTQNQMQHFAGTEDLFIPLSDDEQASIQGGDWGFNLGMFAGGAAVGARQGAVAGAVGGSVAGPVGTTVGLVLGAAIGGAAGYGVEQGWTALHNSKGHWWSFI